MTDPKPKKGVDSDSSDDDQPIAKKPVFVPVLTVYPVVAASTTDTKKQTQDAKMREARFLEVTKDPKYAQLRDKIMAYHRDWSAPIATRKTYTVKALEDMINDMNDHHQYTVPDFLRGVAQLIPPDVSCRVSGELMIVTQACVAAIERENRATVKPFQKLLKRLRE